MRRSLGAVFSTSCALRAYLIISVCIGTKLLGTVVVIADSDHDKISLLHLKRERLHSDELELATDIAAVEKTPDDKENGAERKARLDHLYGELKSTRAQIHEIEDQLSM